MSTDELEPKAVFNPFMDHTSGSSFEAGGLKAEFEVVAKVVVVVPGFNVAYVRDDKNFQYALTKNTPGVDFDEVQEGQIWKCSISSTRLPRVLFAELVP